MVKFYGLILIIFSGFTCGAFVKTILSFGRGLIFIDYIIILAFIVFAIFGILLICHDI